jgi:hypothetical protein
LNFFDSEIHKEGRSRAAASEKLVHHFKACQRSWLGAWGVEFFCDLFGIYTLGPAFAWSHLHLCAKRGQDLFHVPLIHATSHPADDARMTVMLCGLQRLGYGIQAADIAAKWDEFLQISGSSPEPEYLRCFPKALLQQVAEKAFEGMQGMNCNLATPGSGAPDSVGSVLNEAWTQFWMSPSNYIHWERQSVENLI